MIIVKTQKDILACACFLQSWPSSNLPSFFPNYIFYYFIILLFYYLIPQFDNNMTCFLLFSINIFSFLYFILFFSFSKDQIMPLARHTHDHPLISLREGGIKMGLKLGMVFISYSFYKLVLRSVGVTIVVGGFEESWGADWASGAKYPWGLERPRRLNRHGESLDSDQNFYH